MRLGFSGPRIGFFRPWVSFRVGPADRRAPAEPITRAASDFVYVITGQHGRTKVGISTDPQARLSTLQTGSPARLWLAFQTPAYGNAFTIEQEAHRILAPHRIGGEWFAVSPDLAIAAIYGAADRTGCSLSAPAAEETPPRRALSPFAMPLAILTAVFLLGAPIWSGALVCAILSGTAALALFRTAGY